MYFKRIDLQGFKSFAEPVSIEFHEGITCIVGPNGSGKSNISDAIRWVLGEQSPKMLRGGKMEEVIFAGTASRKSRGMAEVTLVIDNATQILPIDYSEVAITRRMYRSGESEYSINKVPCRLRDIRELIMDTGIGVDGYSIIGQGKIADIVSNKPESRREIFEEAAGIVKYRTKKTESERKLEASKGNLERVNDIVGELESRIDGLREDSAKATEYLDLRNRFQAIEVNIILKNVESIELKNEYIKDDVTELTNKIESHKEEKEAVDREAADNRTKSEELEQLANVTRDKLMAQVEEIHSLNNQSQLRKEKLLTIEKDQERLRIESASYEQKRSMEQANAVELREKKVQMEEDINLLRANLETNNFEASQLLKETEEAFQIIDNSKDQIYEIHSQIASKRSEINSLSTLNDTLEKRKQQILLEKGISDTAGSGLSEEYENALQKQEKTRLALEQMEEESRQTKETYTWDGIREKDLNQELGELKITIGQASARRKMIEEMESAYEGYHQGVKFIMKSGQTGLEGVIAELIRVPEGFETAIETALGPALQNIVCREDKDAREAIERLKESKAGRLTFLPLSSIRSSQNKTNHEFSNEKGFRGFGVDCIKFDGKYQSVMEYLLGRVVIVDQLSDAIKLSKKGVSGLRFVTMEGEVINASGAITGGSYRTNTAGLLERKAEGKSLEENLAMLEDKRKTILAQVESLAKTLVETKERLDELDRSYREAERALNILNNDIDRLATRIEDVEGAQVKWTRELAGIDAEKTSTSAMIQELQESVSSWEAKISEAEDRVQSTLTVYETRKSKLDELNEQITQIRVNVASAVGEASNVEQILSRIETYIQEYTDQIKTREEAIITLAEEQQKLLQGDEGLFNRLEEQEKGKAQAEELLRRIQDDKSVIAQTLNALQQKRDAMDGILLEYQTSKYELELKLARNEGQVESYKEKLWEDFEVSYVQAIEYRKTEFVMATALRESREIKSRMKELGEVNIGAIKEYESVKERHEFLTTQRDDLLSAMDALIRIIEDMDKSIRRSFTETFDQIVLNFEKSFQFLFGGGTAELRLEDPTKPLEAGIEIIVQPPGKKLQNINLMSGGEKTMTAIALMFAVLRTKPTPFCILDEVEAALDESNIDRFARYLKDFQEIQFTLVTHQKATMEYADVLYGVTMPEQGISKVISLKMGDDFEL